MKVTLNTYEELADGFVSVILLVERENGKYNNLPITCVEYKPSYLSKNQLLTKIWLAYKPKAISVFNTVWNCRNAPTQPIIEYVPELGESGEILSWNQISVEPVNEDLSPEAISPDEESETFVGFELEELPPEPEKPYQPSLADQVAMLQATIDLLLTGGI